MAWRIDRLYNDPLLAYGNLLAFLKLLVIKRNFSCIFLRKVISRAILFSECEASRDMVCMQMRVNRMDHLGALCLQK
ncbi:hypothetical protein D3C84_1272630 [compost metagenome]